MSMVVSINGRALPLTREAVEELLSTRRRFHCDRDWLQIQITILRVILTKGHTVAMVKPVHA